MNIWFYVLASAVSIFIVSFFPPGTSFWAYFWTGIGVGFVVGETAFHLQRRRRPE